MKNIVLAVILFIVSLFLVSVHSEAKNNFSFPAITVINPIRGNGLGHETDDLLSSLKAQYQVTKEASVHATWLFQYGALENKGMTEYAKHEMKDQEFGLLFEIDRNSASKAGVQFRGQGAWYRSDGLFLNSYDPYERHMLIDKSFSTFKEVFGYYPKTVGAWWIGGDSLSYMQKKYGITAALRAADQFNLDFYSIWGTPWNIPYLSSKQNEGIPASSYNESSKVVILQWAIRDPLQGYADATYSLQDYFLKGYSTDYINYLASIFLQKPYGNLVIGLENGATLEEFQKSYRTMLTKAIELTKDHKARIEPAKDFAKEFLNNKDVFPSQTHFLSTAYNSSDQSFLYISQYYRATIQKINDTIYLVDLRDYSNKRDEDFSQSPNSAPTLRINEPARIDSMRFPESRVVIATTSAPLSMQENGNDVTLFADKEMIAHFIPTEVTEYGQKNMVTKYTFAKGTNNVNSLYIIIMLYIVYLLLICAVYRNFYKGIKEFLPLVIPGLLASAFLINDSVYLFDKKEIFLLQALFSLHFLSIINVIFICKILPIAILYFSHFFLILQRPHRTKKYFYYVLYVLTVFLYAHVPYFPLDKTTYKYLFIAFTSMSALLFAISVYYSAKKRSWRLFAISSTSSVLLLLLISIIIVFSRSTIALTNFELEALNVLKNQHKDVVFVEQKDYSILPIYRAVKPMLFAEFQIGQFITGTKWETVTRPENHVLKMANYDNKVFVIPRYLGSDISTYEMQSLHLKKIFDNAQIAILEKS